nr:hypothetical protein GCM10020092_035420 [Actinoplanes digitatis]
MNLVADRHPGVLAHAYRDLSELAPVPPALWRRATRYRAAGAAGTEPTPRQVADDPARYLRELRDRTADALVAMADLDHPDRVFPTIPQGYASNTVCLAYGTAGVVHALRRLDRPLPPGLLERLRRDALAGAADLGPGLFAGTAGIARVLADCGLTEEAGTLLAAADRHPLTASSATLFGGSAGVALTHLALFGHTGDERHIDRALALAGALPADDDLLTDLIGADDATGLMHGRCGIALMLAQLAELTGEVRLADRAVRLLHAELDRAIDPDAAGLLFPVSAGDRRALPYLFAGSAGMVFAATRVLRASPDERLAAALPRLLAPLRLTYTAMPGLCQGLARLRLHPRRPRRRGRRRADRAEPLQVRRAAPHRRPVPRRPAVALQRGAVERLGGRAAGPEPGARPAAGRVVHGRRRHRPAAGRCGPMSARDLRKYWAGQTLSTFGSVFTAIAMPIVAVEHLDATPAQIGLISAASFVPMVLLGLPAGALADRIARPRRALIILDTFSALAVAVVALGVATDTATVGWLAALAAAQGGALILLEVVYFIHLNQLVEAGELGPARAKLQAGQYAAGFVGRLLVGPTIVLLGAPAAIAVDAVTYLLSVAALLAMGPVAPLVREPIAAAGGAVLDTLRGMTAGLKFFVSDAFHRTLLLFFLVPGAAMAGAAALTAPFVLRVLGVPQAAYGMLFAATGLLGLARLDAGRADTAVRPQRGPGHARGLHREPGQCAAAAVVTRIAAGGRRLRRGGYRPAGVLRRRRERGDQPGHRRRRRRGRDRPHRGAAQGAGRRRGARRRPRGRPARRHDRRPA